LVDECKTVAKLWFRIGIHLSEKYKKTRGYIKIILDDFNEKEYIIQVSS